jgi:serine phosphatase RsbU (regulator of sigma subunit)
MFVGAGYVSRRVWYEAGDIFALVTDGVVETVDDFDAEFGFDRLAQTLCDLQDYPLPEIFNAVQGAVTRHGARQDDQTILLVRAVASE